MKREVKERIAKIPLVGAGAVLGYRAALALRYASRPLRAIPSWLLHSRETTNFTYDLQPLNRAYLAALVSHVTRSPVDDVRSYFEELLTDAELRRHISSVTRGSDRRHRADATVRYGRRIAWYAFVRCCRPRLVVETGVDKGLGACVLSAALLRNADEGKPGRYIGTDINPSAGFLLKGRYEACGEVLYGDSIEQLDRIGGPIDLFVGDSDHSADYEAREYKAIQMKLAPHALVVSDNAHVTLELLHFAETTQREFLFLREEPLRHWYPGAGVGVAFR